MSNVPSNQQIQIQSNPMLPSSFLCLRQDPCNSSGVTFRQVSDETQCALEERVPTAAIFESRQQRRRGSQQRWWRRCKRRERRSRRKKKKWRRARNRLWQRLTVEKSCR
ncbi:hypothetical protein JHK82_032663 [Glycine max]|nr:hypothetical protein JHK82_032663 [Glycine max]